MDEPPDDRQLAEGPQSASLAAALAGRPAQEDEAPGVLEQEARQAHAQRLDGGTQRVVEQGPAARRTPDRSRGRPRGRRPSPARPPRPRRRRCRRCGAPSAARRRWPARRRRRTGRWTPSARRRRTRRCWPSAPRGWSARSWSGSRGPGPSGTSRCDDASSRPLQRRPLPTSDAQRRTDGTSRDDREGRPSSSTPSRGAWWVGVALSTARDPPATLPVPDGQVVRHAG